MYGRYIPESVPRSSALSLWTLSLSSHPPIAANTCRVCSRPCPSAKAVGEAWPRLDHSSGTECPEILWESKLVDLKKKKKTYEL